MRSLTVTKCHGTGNDFVLLDARELTPSPDYAALARELCHRRFSIGADGLLVLERPGADGPPRMRIFNADGSEAQMCGNGIRCVARYLHEEDRTRTGFDILTAAGLMHADIVDWRGEPGARISMGVPRVVSTGRPLAKDGLSTLTVDEIDMGNPHAVVFIPNDLASFDLELLADTLTGGHPDRTNVEVAVVAAEAVEMRVRERGVGETFACGTGACAVAVAAIADGKARTPVIVRSTGGAVEVDWAGPGKTAFLTGDAHLVFQTTVQTPIVTSPSSS